MRPTHARRLEALGRRIRERSPERRDGAAIRYLRGLLGRYAAAKQQRAVTPELEAEMGAVGEAVRRRAAELRGGGDT